MLKLRSILSLILFAQYGLFAADPSPQYNKHFDGWGLLLVELLKQQSLQPHLCHSSAYPLICVSKKLNVMMNEHREHYRKIIWQIPLPNNSITDLPLKDGTIVKKLSIVFDASSNVAWGLHIPEKQETFNEGIRIRHVPALCCFSWPSRNLRMRKSIPINANVCDTWYDTFFGHSIGFVCIPSTSKAETDIIGYLPTGYAMHLHVKNVGKYGIDFNWYIHEPKRLTIMCVNYDTCSNILFTTDLSAVIKKPDGTVIPWRKIDQIDWDDEMDTDKS